MKHPFFFQFFQGPRHPRHRQVEPLPPGQPNPQQVAHRRPGRALPGLSYRLPEGNHQKECEAGQGKKVGS